MVVLGGMGTLFGPLFGAIAFFAAGGIAEAAARPPAQGWGEYWQIVFGPMLVLIALYARGGIDSPARARRRWLSRCCATDRPGQALRRAGRDRRRLARRAAGRDPRRDRPQRRRQDDADRPAHRRPARPTPAPSVFAGRDVTRLPTHARVRLGLARSFQITSRVPRVHARSTMSPWRSRRMPATPSVSWRLPARDRACATARAAPADGRASPTAPTRAAALQPWRAAPARDRDGAGGRPAGCCCSTSRWPAWAPRNRSAWWRCLRGAEGRSARCCWSSTTWTRSSRSADRITVLVYGRVIATRHAGGRSAPTPRCARPISATRKDRPDRCSRSASSTACLRRQPGAVRHRPRRRARARS